jgi:hypothetical protein
MTLCAMKDFDSEQRKRLRFLADQEAHLHFPFFANTFSLAYHYANCLLDYAGRRWPGAKEFISEHDWEDPYPKLLSGKLNIFYATSQGLADLERDNTINPAWSLVGYPFTRYRPRWVFVDSRASVLSHWNGRAGTLTFPQDLASIVRNLNNPHLELLTDIPGQSGVITERLREHDIALPEVLADPKDALRRIDPSQGMLRLYFYGAPTTTKMLSDPARFIPFEIPDKVVGFSEPTTITQVCLAKPLNTMGAISDEERTKFCSEMAKYHERIFAAAAPDRHTELVDVWWAYNRFAERKQHTATFKTTEILARCLREHHAQL